MILSESNREFPSQIVSTAIGEHSSTVSVDNQNVLLSKTRIASYKRVLLLIFPNLFQLKLTLKRVENMIN